VDKSQVVEGSEREARRLEALALAATAEMERRGPRASTGAASTAEWLSGRLGIRPAVAKGRVALGGWLDGDGTPCQAALASGQITSDHARVIHRALDQLPDEVDPETRVEAQEFLLDQAQHLDPAALARIGRHMQHRLDAHGGQQMAREEARQADRNEFTVAVDGRGVGWLSGRLDPVATGTLLAALDPLAAPQPASDGGYDMRSPALRRAEALMQLVERAMAIPEGESGALPGQAGVRPRLLVTVPLATLMTHLDTAAGVEPAATGWEQVIPARTAQRLSCDAEIVPVLIARSRAATGRPPGATCTTCNRSARVGAPPLITALCSAALTTGTSTPPAGPAGSSTVTSPGNLHPADRGRGR
jgi:hypothetical protein